MPRWKKNTNKQKTADTGKGLRWQALFFLFSKHVTKHTNEQNKTNTEMKLKCYIYMHYIYILIHLMAELSF